MNRPLILRCAAFAAAFTFGFAMLAPAQAEQSDGEVLRRAQLQLRQSEQERNTLRSEVSRLQAQLTTQTDELNRLRGALGESQQQASAAQSTLGVAAQKNQLAIQALKDSQGELLLLRTQTQRQQQALGSSQATLAGTQTRLDQQVELVELCRTRNQELYKVGHELIGLYGDVGYADVAGRREPVLHLSRVKLENLMQSFEDRLREQRVYADTLPPSVEKQMQESLQASKAAAAKPQP
ncbi:MAG: hypothetical protein ACREVL_11135 [Solimonas sp.]